MGEGLLLGDAQRLVGWRVLTKAGSALYIVLTLFIPLSPVVIGFDVTHRALRVGQITSPRTPPPLYEPLCVPKDSLSFRVYTASRAMKRK